MFKQLQNNVDLSKINKQKKWSNKGGAFARLMLNLRNDYNQLVCMRINPINGNIYVNINNMIGLYNQYGEYLETHQDTTRTISRSIFAFDRYGCIYIYDNLRNILLKYDINNQFIKRYNGNFYNGLQTFAIQSNGNIIISKYGENKIKIIDQDDKLITEINGTPLDYNSFTDLKKIVCHNNKIYFFNRNGIIIVYSYENHEYKFHSIIELRGKYDLVNIDNFDILNNNIVVIGSVGNSNIYVKLINMESEQLIFEKMILTNNYEINDVIIDDNNIYVADQLYERVLIINYTDPLLNAEDENEYANNMLNMFENAANNANNNQDRVVQIQQNNNTIDGKKQLKTLEDLLKSYKKQNNNSTLDLNEVKTSLDATIKMLKCSICMENIKAYILDNCNHTFCRTCIYRHQTVSDKCPLCRAEFTIINKIKF